MSPSGMLGGTQGVWDGAQLSTLYEASAIPTVLSLGPTTSFLKQLTLVLTFYKR